jgi:ankyrin repeat protein
LFDFIHSIVNSPQQLDTTTMSSPLSDSRKARRYSEAFDEEDEQLSRLFEASASRERQYSIVSVLDQGKLSTNSKGVFGDTALHFAAHAGNAPG